MEANPAPEDGQDVAPVDAVDSPAATSPGHGARRWVESSWELCRGLTVHEGLPPDPGLDEWLEAFSRG